MSSKYEELLGYVSSTRRYLHMYPEMGFCEHNTSKYIAGLLKQSGLDVIENAAGTGVIGILKGKEGLNSIAVRADMDCLKVLEETGLEYSSLNEGFMHACGHDGHMAAAVGLARHLSQSDKLKSDIVFIFQPAEEGPGGAKPIVESGVLDGLRIKAVLGMHIYPEIEEGRIGCCTGPMTARNGEIDIKITGKSGHGALPHTACDSIVASSQLLQSIQTIISRKIDPRDNAVITFGRIYGGQVRNIIAGDLTLEGTIRAFSSEVYDEIKKNIYIVCEGIGIANSCRIDAVIRDMYPEVYNDKTLFDALIKACGEENVDIIKPLMIAEDFSYYRQIAPEIMFLMGSRNASKGYLYPLHNSKFNFDESILLKAINVFDNIIHIIDEQ